MFTSGVDIQMKFSDGQSEFLRVFNFVILGYSQNSRKLDAHEKLVLVSDVKPSRNSCSIYSIIGLQHGANCQAAVYILQ